MHFSALSWEDCAGTIPQEKIMYSWKVVFYEDVYFKTFHRVANMIVAKFIVYVNY